MIGRILSLLLVFLFQHAGAQVEPDLWRYPVEHGHILYQYTGDTEGQRTLYFNDFGKEQAVYTELVRNSTFFAVETSTPEKVIEILIEGKHYHFDLSTKTGYLLDFHIHLLFKYFRLPKDKTIEHGLKSIGAQFESEEVWNGYQCEKWTYRGRTFLLWNGLLLKLRSTGLNKDFTMEAVEIDFKKPVSHEKFKFPQGVKFVE